MRQPTAASTQQRLSSAHAVVRALSSIDKPVIAAVRGPVAGMGCSFVWACDLVVASETTVFHHSFQRIGLAPDGGAVFFLRQRLGPALAKELVYTGRPLPAAEALDRQLINQVVPDGELNEVARQLALSLAGGPTFAFRLAKRLFRAFDAPSLDTFLQTEAGFQGLATLSRDHEEGARAFREKRPPEFVGY